MIRSFLLFFVVLLRFAHPNSHISTAIRPAKSIIFVSVFLFSSISFADDYYWYVFGFSTSHFSTPELACSSKSDIRSGYTFSGFSKLTVRSSNSFDCHYLQTSTTTGVTTSMQSSRYVLRGGTSCPANTTYNSSTGSCDAPPPCLGDSVRDPSTGICVLTCPIGTVPDNTAMVCNSMCPTGKFWDFESESCKYPEDELCPTGSNWNSETKDCVCDGEGVLSNSSGFRICMPLADSDCTPESPDYIGMISSSDGRTKPYCNGRARCPDGTKLGSIGKGADSTSVCIPDQGTDESCPGGQSGNLNGKHVCVPKPNEDPDCPGGQSGMVNGVKKCIPKPGDPGSCKEGETAGFTGTGSEMNAVCVPSNYKPDTCPPGQYAWNTASGGFACVKLPSQPKDPIRDDPNTPDVDESKVANQGSITAVNKDAEGNVTGTSKMEIEFPEEGLEIEGLLTEEPQINYFKDSTKFSESELEKLDDPQKEFLRDMISGDGAFTERSKLDQASGLLGDVFGNGNAGCTGQLVLGQHNGTNYAVSCEKLGKMKELFSWFIYITTIFAIYGVLMRHPVS